MQKNNSFSEIFNLLILSGERIPAIYKWMTDSVWTEERFKSYETTKYYEEGEKQILKLEELILNTASGIYDELASMSLSNFSILKELQDSKTALVIFDGMSLREIPLIKKLARATGFSIEEANYKYASLPSDTKSFIEQRILGKSIAPSQLESRKELKEINIKSFYYDTPIRHFEIPSNGSSYLLWSSFPDGTYLDFEARNSHHFETLIKHFDVVWKNIILAIPKDYRIIITSDHGYVYLNSGFETSEKGEVALSFLEQERFRFYDGSGAPLDVNELQIISQKKLAMLRGRIKNRPKGHTSNKVFRHGGLSLMEMLTPWIELKRN